MRTIKFLKNFATKKKGDVWSCDSILARSLINRKIAKYDNKATAAAEEAAAEKAAAEKGAAEKGAAEKAAAEKGAAEKGAAEKGAAEKGDLL